MATVTREQRAIEAWAKAMATAENYAVDPHQHIARLVEAGEQMAALLAPKDAAALASPQAENAGMCSDCHTAGWCELVGCLAEQNASDARQRESVSMRLAPPASATPDSERATMPLGEQTWTTKQLVESVLHGIKSAREQWVCPLCERQSAQPASDPPGPTVINEDDGDVTIDFDYANDRVVSIRLGEESSGLSAFVDGESYALCPLDRVPPKVLALLRTSAKAVTLRQSDPPGLVANWRPIETAPKRTDVLAGWADRPHWLPQVLQQDDAGMWFNGEESDYRPPTHWMPLPASPQAETTKGDE